MKPVLYAEDEPDDITFMQYVWELLRIPNPLVDVPDGQKAIEYLAGDGDFADRRKHPFPCLVLLDLNMPGKNGFDVLRWIRQRSEIKSLRVAIVSGSDQENDISTAYSLGVVDYMVKPTGFDRLLEAVRDKQQLWFGDST